MLGYIVLSTLAVFYVQNVMVSTCGMGYYFVFFRLIGFIFSIFLSMQGILLSW